LSRPDFYFEEKKSVPNDMGQVDEKNVFVGCFFEIRPAKNKQFTKTKLVVSEV
jgi:hypothetical protein